MKIKYIITRASATATKMTNRDATHITAAVYRQNHTQLVFTIRDLALIFFEQTMLTNYLLNANPANNVLLDYRATLQHNFKQYFDKNEITPDLILQQQLSAIDIQLISNFVIDKKPIPGSAISGIIQAFTGTAQSKFGTIPSDFSVPYLSLEVNSLHILNKGEEYANPVVLSPRCRKDKTDSSALIITMYARVHTSLRNIQTHSFGKNTTLAYICAMNYTGRSWKELLDAVQSLYVPGNSPMAAFESLSGVLNHYLHGRSLPPALNSKQYSQQLIQIWQHAMAHNPGLLNKEMTEIKQFCSVFEYLNDLRISYLTLTDPIVAAKEHWDNQFDLRFLTEYSLIGYGMEADKSDDPDANAPSTETQTDDEPTGADTDDKNDDATDGDTDEQNLFDDGDLASDDANDDDGGGDGSDTSTDTTSSSSSSSDNLESSSDSEKSEIGPEDVNPLIELIDDETFDEYLDRGILQHRIKALINNPPASISSQDVEFLKYWFIQWFSCVSVATTREILGDLLEPVVITQ